MDRRSCAIELVARLIEPPNATNDILHEFEKINEVFQEILQIAVKKPFNMVTSGNSDSATASNSLSPGRGESSVPMTTPSTTSGAASTESPDETEISEWFRVLLNLLMLKQHAKFKETISQFIHEYIIKSAEKDVFQIDYATTYSQLRGFPTNQRGRKRSC